MTDNKLWKDCSKEEKLIFNKIKNKWKLAKTKKESGELSVDNFEKIRSLLLLWLDYTYIMYSDDISKEYKYAVKNKCKEYLSVI